MKIKKAVIPVAGKGTRFLPATKEIPKEIIPLVDKPMLLYAVEEAVNSGIEQIVFVTASGKEVLENFFDRNMELEAFLEKNNKVKELEMIRNLGTMVEIVSVRQKEQLGLGHAVLCAKDIIGNDTFAVILSDDLVHSKTPVTKQLVDISQKYETRSVIGVMDVPREDTFKYGIVDGEYVDSDKTLLMKTMIEKPKPDAAPTTLATPGRYILTAEIFDCLQSIKRGAGNEYQLTDAINMLASKDQVYAHVFEGDRFDTGNIPNYLEATVEFALRNEDTSSIMKDIILKVAKRHGISL